VLAADGSRWPFEVEPLRRVSLLEGLDDIGLTLKHAGAIDEWESADLAVRPWNWPMKTAGL
jgi:3-isopropylmalate/(R)-2-methylmalate dehydratase small subunit